MNKDRIVKFLDSLERCGIMAADQQSVVLQPVKDDVIAGSNSKNCLNKTVDSCKGVNEHCTNQGKACADSVNDVCINSQSGSSSTNVSTTSCRG